MSTGNKLINKTLADQAMAYVLKSGVSKEWFPNDQDRAVWTFMVDHYKKYGSDAAPSTVKANHPTFGFKRVSDNLDFLIDTAKDELLNRRVYAMLEDAINLMPKGSDQVLSLVNQRITDLTVTTVASSDLDLVGTVQDQIQEYSSPPVCPPMLLGFPTIDRTINGIHPEQLIVLTAQPKAGKTFVLMKMAIELHKQGKRVMFQSFEMSNTEQRDRHNALRAGISSLAIRNRSLSSVEMVRLKQMLTALGNEDDGSFMLIDSSSAMSLSQLGAKVAEHDPDVVIVDGVYLMQDEVTGESNTPQAITNLTRGFKRIAQRLKKPIIISTQSLISKQVKGRTSMYSAGYASSWAQDADVMLGLDHFVVEGSPEERHLKVLASRNSGLIKVGLHWDLNNGIIQEAAVPSTAGSSQVSASAMNIAEGGDEEDE